MEECVFVAPSTVMVGAVYIPCLACTIRARLSNGSDELSEDERPESLNDPNITMLAMNRVQAAITSALRPSQSDRTPA